MKRPLLWSIAAAVGAVAGAAWLVSSGKLGPVIAVVAPNLGSTARIPTGKPICTSPVNPNVAPPTNCIPQHLANLPPDPGQVGNLTIEGIDSDKDGVRDDVQIKIEEKYGDSRRAVAALRLVAIHAQETVKLGDSVSHEKAYEIAQKAANMTRCYINTVNEQIVNERALEYVTSWTTNTRERFERYRAFDNLLNNRIFMASDAEIPEACGYDPAALPN